jgi:hypothetical protein
MNPTGSIRPPEAQDMLLELADSRDEEIAEAAAAAITMAQAMSGGEDDEEVDDDGNWIN